MEAKHSIAIPRWGTLPLTKEEWAVVSHPAFQRLQHIRQLGLSFLVFPQAEVRRFEHCIAVGNLAGYAATVLQSKHPDKKIQNKDVVLARIGGLCHDLGHGPFSHTFDEYLIVSKYADPIRRHEERSCVLVEWLLKQYPNLFSKRDIAAVQAIIDPKNYPCPPDFPRVLTELVSNEYHGLDVDRVEYISGDVQHLRPTLNKKLNAYKLLNGCFINQDDHWEYDPKDKEEVAEILSIRKRLYQEFYHHPVTHKLELILIKMLEHADEILDISKCSSLSNERDILMYLSLTDNLLLMLQRTEERQLRIARSFAQKVVPMYECDNIYQ